MAWAWLLGSSCIGSAGTAGMWGDHSRVEVEWQLLLSLVMEGRECPCVWLKGATGFTNFALSSCPHNPPEHLLGEQHPSSILSTQRLGL